MLYDNGVKRRNKPWKKIVSCPKCGNKEDLIIIPGLGATFYFCPECDKQKTKQRKGYKNGQKSRDS